jgi:hypothetical protein
LDHDATSIPAAEPVALEQPSTLRKIFVGEDGLRAGWSLLVFVAIFAAIVFCMNFIGHRYFPSAAACLGIRLRWQAQAKKLLRWPGLGNRVPVAFDRCPVEDRTSGY